MCEDCRRHLQLHAWQEGSNEGPRSQTPDFIFEHDMLMPHLGSSLEGHARDARLLSNTSARQRRHAAAVHEGAVHLVHLLGLLRVVESGISRC